MIDTLSRYLGELLPLRIVFTTGISSEQLQRELKKFKEELSLPEPGLVVRRVAGAPPTAERENHQKPGEVRQEFEALRMSTWAIIALVSGIVLLAVAMFTAFVRVIRHMFTNFVFIDPTAQQDLIKWIVGGSGVAAVALGASIGGGVLSSIHGGSSDRHDFWLVMRDMFTAQIGFMAITLFFSYRDRCVFGLRGVGLAQNC